MGTANNSGIFTAITSGLSSTYSILANAAGTNGVTLESIASARTNTSLNTQLNPTFASYIQTNFSTLDTDRDGILSSAELSNATTKMAATGFTAAQLSQLGTASGMSGATLEQVLEHFSEIDTNGDGKVTSAEVSAFKVKSAGDQKKSEFALKAAADQSVFYGDDNASTANSTSILSSKYWNSGNNTTSSSSS